MDSTDRADDIDHQDADSEVKKILVPLNASEFASLRLKLLEGEDEVHAIKRIISESFERDAIESALSKFIEVLEKLIVLQKKLNWLGIDSDEESDKQVRELRDSVMSVTSLKKKLERRWKTF